jgi:cytochrome c-type biogenesis protein CcmH/NrfG
MLQLLKLQPNNVDVHIQLGRIYVRANLVEEAKKVQLCLYFPSSGWI